MKKENDVLEETLSIAEKGYAAAYGFLLEAYEKNPEHYGPQTLYFLACLAGGAGLVRFPDGEGGAAAGLRAVQLRVLGGLERL